MFTSDANHNFEMVKKMKRVIEQPDKRYELSSDEPDTDCGNAAHNYTFWYTTDEGNLRAQMLSFQHGPASVAGINGTTNELVIRCLIDRLEGFQSSKFACQENTYALRHLRDALFWLEQRTEDRKRRNVEGTHDK